MRSLPFPIYSTREKATLGGIFQKGGWASEEGRSQRALSMKLRLLIKLGKSCLLGF